MWMEWILHLSNLLWQWVLPPALLGTAILCGRAQRFAPLRGFRGMLRDTYGSLLRPQHEHTANAPNQRQIFATALAATMGTGNLIGTAAAILAGGAGAVFWMWISALIGMVLVYAENLLSIRFRRQTHDGAWRGGALGYLRYGLGAPMLAGIFAVCCAMAGLGMGSMAQTNAIAAAAGQFQIPPLMVGMLVCAVGLWILRGKRATQKIGQVTIWLMPLLCGFYLLGCSILLCRHAAQIPAAFERIFREAFGFRAAAGGVSASIFLQSLRVGLRRGIFSNEAGLGSSALLHMEAASSTPTMQGKWAAAEVFADTIICCTATALVILTTPSLPAAADGAALLLAAFSQGLGRYAGGFLALSMALLAFATFIGWYPCGVAAFRDLFPHGADIYLALYLLVGFAGALGQAEWIFALCDCCNACMAIPNLIGMCRLRHLLRDDFPISKTEEVP